MFSYKPLWKMLIDRNMTQTELRQKANFTAPVLAKMNKEEPVSLDILDRICNSLDCEIQDIIKHVRE